MSATSRSPAPPADKKYFTVAEAEATLPLLRVILRDITTLALDMRERHERLVHLQGAGTISAAHQEEMQGSLAEFGRLQEQMRAYESELASLHVELKDYFTGLVDFLAWRDDREVYLCWRLGEPAVAHWHELDSGFAGRQQLAHDALRGAGRPSGYHLS
jgi:hypothetical protein